MAAKCRKCNNEVRDCNACKGSGSISQIGGRMSCSQCDGSGKQCVNGHGKHWR